MELRQLEYLVAVAEEANFTRAAERLHISQSGVSARIKQLEHELGAVLFDRSARSATLTDAGQAALEHARAALAAVDAVSDAVGQINQLSRGRIVLGMVIGCTITPLFEALAAFHRAHPGIEVSVREGTSDQLVAALRRGELDLALIGCAERPPEGRQVLTILSEGLVAVVPAEHPLAGRRSIRLAEVVEHGVVCMPPGTGLRAVFDRSCAAHDLHPVVALQASAADAIADLAARGLGAGILSASMAHRYTDRLRTLPIRDVTVPAVLALLWRPVASAATRELARRCRTAFGLPDRPARTSARRAAISP